jgi:RecA/RadA recombinase
MISDPTAFTQSRTIIQDSYFDDELRPAVRFILEYADQYKTLPVPSQVKASTGISIEKFEGSEPQHTKWYLNTVEGFCRHRALESAVLEGTKLLDEGNYGEVERRVKEALTISLVTDIGTDYFADPKERHSRLKDKSNQFTTGWKTLDRRLYGGFERGALNIFAGGSGSGKSLFLQNLALNWAYEGLNVLYVSLELSEDLVALRLDAMVTGQSTKEVFRRSDELATSIAIKGKSSGKLYVKKLPEGGTTVNEIRALVKEIEIQTGRKIDALLVDYLDLLYPTDKRINPSDLFVKDKYTSEELRGLSSEINVFCATASQLNRQSVDATEFDHSHIAGGISKINTADNLFAIMASSSMKTDGKIKIQFLKTRSSDAVGQHLILSYDPASMRITDMPDGMEEQDRRSPEDIKRELKEKVVVGSSGSTSGSGISDRLNALRKEKRGETSSG